MAFEMQYKDTIQARMVKEMAKVSDKSTVEGSFSRDAINANSVEFENAYAEMSLMMEASFADSAWSEYLTMRCAEYGIDRKAATKATGSVVFAGDVGSIVPAGSLIEVKSGSQFTTDADATVGQDGTAAVKITAVTAGESGNVAAGAISNIPMSIPGISSVTNAAATQDGFDAETDDELKSRYYVAIRTPATSGNKFHYYNWAMAQEGVGACRVLPLWDGPGTVKVMVVNSDMQTASDAIIARVAAYIESVRPIGADVTVVSPTPKPVNITVDVAGTVDLAAFRKAMNSYMSKSNLEMKYLSAAQVGEILMQQNISDYDNLLLNGGTRVKMSEDELLTIGEVTINELHT